jgi:DNA-binding GntR family transcriptional regulator
LIILGELVDEINKPHTTSEVGILNNRFHLTIAAASGNRLLVSEISQRRAELYADAFALAEVELPLPPGNDAHPGIVEAMTARDGQLASMRMWEHHQFTMDGVLTARRG